MTVESTFAPVIRRPAKAEVPEHALGFDEAAVNLHTREDDGWVWSGSAKFEDPDLAGRLATLRRRIAGTEAPLPVAVIIPDDQILYTTVEASAGASGAAAVAAALPQLTPYAPEELSVDWREREDGQIAVAAVWRQTLTEANAFARRYGFDPKALLADPEGRHLAGGVRFLSGDPNEGGAPMVQTDLRQVEAAPQLVQDMAVTARDAGAAGSGNAAGDVAAVRDDDATEALAQEGESTPPEVAEAMERIRAISRRKAGAGKRRGQDTGASQSRAQAEEEVEATVEPASGAAPALEDNGKTAPRVPGPAGQAAEAQREVARGRAAALGRRSELMARRGAAPRSAVSAEVSALPPVRPEPGALAGWRGRVGALAAPILARGPRAAAANVAPQVQGLSRDAAVTAPAAAAEEETSPQPAQVRQGQSALAVRPASVRRWRGGGWSGGLGPWLGLLVVGLLAAMLVGGREAPSTLAENDTQAAPATAPATAPAAPQASAPEAVEVEAQTVARSEPVPTPVAVKAAPATAATEAAPAAPPAAVTPKAPAPAVAAPAATPPATAPAAAQPAVPVPTAAAPAAPRLALPPATEPALVPPVAAAAAVTPPPAAAPATAAPTPVLSGAAPGAAAPAAPQQQPAAAAGREPAITEAPATAPASSAAPQPAPARSPATAAPSAAAAPPPAASSARPPAVPDPEAIARAIGEAVATAPDPRPAAVRSLQDSAPAPEPMAADPAPASPQAAGATPPASATPPAASPRPERRPSGLAPAPAAAPPPPPAAPAAAAPPAPQASPDAAPLTAPRPRPRPTAYLDPPAPPLVRLALAGPAPITEAERHLLSLMPPALARGAASVHRRSEAALLGPVPHRVAQARPPSRPGGGPSVRRDAVEAAIGAAVAEAGTPAASPTLRRVAGTGRPPRRPGGGAVASAGSLISAGAVEGAIAAAIEASPAPPGGVKLTALSSSPLPPSRPSSRAGQTPDLAPDPAAEAAAEAAANRSAAPVPEAEPDAALQAERRRLDDELQREVEARIRARAAADAQVEAQQRAAAEARARAQAAAEARAAAARRQPVVPTELDNEPEVTAPVGGGKTSATVAGNATIKDGMDLSRTTLIGVIGAGPASRGLIRLRNGRIVTVRLGDRIDGGTISSIGNGRITYVKAGRPRELRILDGR